jgi:hypothetical protein
MVIVKAPKQYVCELSSLEAPSSAEPLIHLKSHSIAWGYQLIYHVF